MKKKHHPLYLTVLYPLFFLTLTAMGSCSQSEVESFAVRLYAPREEGWQQDGQLSLAEEPGVRPEQEGRLLPLEGGYASPRYTLARDAEREAESFHVYYSSTSLVKLELHFDNDERRDLILEASGGEPREYLVPLRGRDLLSFRFVSNGPTEPEFRLLELALRRRSAKGRPGERGYGFLHFPDEAGKEPRFGQYQVSLRYQFSPQQEESRSGEEIGDYLVEIELESAEGSRGTYDLYAKPGGHGVYFYSRDLGFSPHRLAIDSELEGFQVEGLSYGVRSLFAARRPEPIPADPGIILDYPRQLWRRGDWELFSWNIFPSILFFDFRDYQVQANFLKRLAFFVEKKGSAGELLPNEVIADRHGWNAHDYRAGDLARFFELARRSGFRLNQEEYLLREILLDQGIIKMRGESYQAGEGGILSLSQESSERLRYLFMIHEAYHGLFFASAEYRLEVERLWRALEEDEREFWRVFLDWRSYNTEDEYLLMNEFQAYLMQQDLSYVETYFKDYTIPRFLRLYPEFTEAAEYFLDEYPDHFIDSAREVEKAAWQVAGIQAGDLLCLRRREGKIARTGDEG
ncbi:MAG TPA: hypothetical protein ENN41_05580 [Sediminispirochaeta sp.]|nr:hypothetical protein [Sediminispirochaeta sp.]